MAGPEKTVRRSEGSTGRIRIVCTGRYLGGDPVSLPNKPASPPWRIIVSKAERAGRGEYDVGRTDRLP